MTGATFGGPVNAGEPGDGGPVNAGEPADGGPVTAGEPDVVPDADADHPELSLNNDLHDAAQVDNGDGDPVEGGSSNDRGAPCTLNGQTPTLKSIEDMTFMLRTWIVTIQSMGLTFMPVMQCLRFRTWFLPLLVGLITLVRNQCLNLGSCFIMNGFWLMSGTTYIHGISDRIWFILQEDEPHSDAIHEFLEVHRRPESLINRIVFALAFESCSHYGPSLAMLPGEGRGPHSAFLEWTVWGYFDANLGGWGSVTGATLKRCGKASLFDDRNFTKEGTYLFCVSPLEGTPFYWLALEYGSSYR